MPNSRVGPGMVELPGIVVSHTFRDEIDQARRAGGYSNRAEFIRAALRVAVATSIPPTPGEIGHHRKQALQDAAASDHGQLDVGPAGTCRWCGEGLNYGHHGVVIDSAGRTHCSGNYTRNLHTP